MTQDTKALKLGIIGAGNMASALISGLLATKTLTAAQIRAADPDPSRAATPALSAIEVTTDNAAVAGWSNALLLAVKPQTLDAALASCAQRIATDCLLVSVAAGVTTKRIEGALGGKPRVVRVMPNTPALVGAGASALARGAHATEADLELVQMLFQAVGTTIEVPETQLDAVTALSGSGPGYFMVILEALIDGAVQVGLPRATAQQLAVQTMLGSARLQQETGLDPATLKAQVTSPGGTTIAGIYALEKAGLRQALMDAIAQATQRSRDLG